MCLTNSGQWCVVPNLRDRDAYRDAAWDWSIFNGCFGGKIRPSDIDGVVERKGHFLFLEAKAKRGRMGVGQEILLRRLSGLPRCVVLVMYGDNDNPESMQLIRGGNVERRQPCDLDIVRMFVEAWYDAADSQPEGLPTPDEVREALPDHSEDEG